MNDKKKEWRKKTREYLAVAFGGACTICGYNKTIAALDYHHLDPTQKDKMLCVAMRNGYAWSRIVEEARKCTIVCSRCHREIHAGVTELPENYARFNEKYADVIKLKTCEFDACPICGTEKNKRQKFCSAGCASDSQKRFEVSKEELEALVAEKTYKEIGEMFGVSDKAIVKRCKSYGITLVKRRGLWMKLNEKTLSVSKECLASMLETKSINALAEEFGVTHKVVKRVVSNYGLEIPKINWHKISAQNKKTQV